MKLHYIDSDSFVLNVKTTNLIKDSFSRLRDSFDYRNLDKEHPLFRINNRKVTGNFKKRTPESIWLDEFVCLGSKAYSYKCGNDSETTLKEIINNTSSKNIKIEEFFKCLYGMEHRNARIIR